MDFSAKIREKLGRLPDRPGVYIMRDRNGRIIYIGKAASLRNRVRSYFQRSALRSAHPKLRGLVAQIDDFDLLEVRTEAEAILTEGRLIKEYRPHYNIAFKDDKRFLLLKVNLNDPFPRFETCRIEKKDESVYFGPYADARAPRAALEFIEKQFGLRVCRPRTPGAEDHRHCHNDILRYCSAPCIGKISPDAYRQQAEEACAFLRGERPGLLKEIEAAMKTEATAQRYEEAAALRDLLLKLRKAVRERNRVHKDLPRQSAEAQDGLVRLQNLLVLPEPPKVIECFDISNISGTKIWGQNAFFIFSRKTATSGSSVPRMSLTCRARLDDLPISSRSHIQSFFTPVC